MSSNMQLHPEEGVLRCYAWVASRGLLLFMIIFYHEIISKIKTF